jgi:AcrR family transcriptional regulator
MGQKRQMQDRSVVTINNILDASRRLFIEKQYADVSLREITEVAGVTKGALYHHFATKEDLYLQMIHRCLSEVKETVRISLEQSRGESCRNRLFLSLVSFLNLPSETLASIRSIRRNINIFAEPARTQLVRAYQAALPAQIEALLTDGMAKSEIIPMDARLLSWQHVAVVEVSLHDYGRQQLGNPEEMADSIVNLFYDGIKSPPSS